MMVISGNRGFYCSQPLYFQKFLSHSASVIHSVLQRSVSARKKLLFSKQIDSPWRRPPALRSQGCSRVPFLVFISISNREPQEVNSP